MVGAPISIYRAYFVFWFLHMEMKPTFLFCYCCLQDHQIVDSLTGMNLVRCALTLADLG